MAAKNYVVAIELGSTTITGIAGQKKPDGTITDIKIVREDASQCIRKGVVYNIDKTAQCIQNIVTRLNQSLKMKVYQIYVGVGGQSIHSELNTVVEELDSNSIVTQERVATIDDKNHTMQYADMKILDVAVQGYRADSIPQKDPVGVPCSRLEGHFLNVLQAKRHFKNVNMCFDKSEINVAEFITAPLALADAVITPDEKRSGCVLVDLGATTTTVVVYSKDVLRQVVVIPLGSNNITKDICELQVDEKEAEQLKLKYASAYTPVEEIDTNAKYAISDDRTVDAPLFIDIVEARVREIISNVWKFVPDECKDNQLRGGVVLSGGGANLKGIEQAFRKHCNVEKVRVAKFVNMNIVTNNSDVRKDATMNTLLGILAKGALPCCNVAEHVTQQPLFANNHENETPAMGGTTNTVQSAPQEPGVQPQVVVTQSQPAPAASSSTVSSAAEVTPVSGNQPEVVPEPAPQPVTPDPAPEEPKAKKKGLGARFVTWLSGLTEAD